MNTCTRQDSWFLARAFAHLAQHDIRGVVAFSDPVPRVADDGRIVLPGHIGTIYQASNALYLKQAQHPRTVTLLPDGTTLTDRAISRVRRRERGHDYVVRRLVALGAPLSPARRTAQRPPEMPRHHRHDRRPQRSMDSPRGRHAPVILAEKLGVAASTAERWSQAVGSARNFYAALAVTVQADHR